MSLDRIHAPTYIMKLLNQLNRLITDQDLPLEENEPVRRAILEATQTLMRLVQTPEEAVRDNAFSPIHNMCVRVGIDLEIFRVVHDFGPVAAIEIANVVEAQEELIVRLMRVLTGIGFIREVGTRLYAANDVTRTMLIPSTAASIIHFFDQGLPSITALPQYFRKFGYISPDDYVSGPFQFGHKTDLETYSYWLTQPEVINNFDTFMNGGKLGNQRRWTDWFPTQEVIVHDFDNKPDAVMLVDVAGGRGHDIDAFRQKHDVSGRLVLEDLPETVQQVTDLDSRIEKLGHNFFEKQPIEGARAYFIQDIFHNWPTSVARLILRNVIAAMIPGYSKLLVSELVLPDKNCPVSMAGLDFGMMFLHSGLERSERQWRDLLEGEGLEVVQVHHEPRGDGAVIELILPSSSSGV